MKQHTNSNRQSEPTHDEPAIKYARMLETPQGRRRMVVVSRLGNQAACVGPADVLVADTGDDVRNAAVALAALKALDAEGVQEGRAASEPPGRIPVSALAAKVSPAAQLEIVAAADLALLVTCAWQDGREKLELQVKATESLCAELEAAAKGSPGLAPIAVMARKVASRLAEAARGSRQCEDESRRFDRALADETHRTIPARGQESDSFDVPTALWCLCKSPEARLAISEAAREAADNDCDDEPGEAHP